MTLTRPIPKAARPVVRVLRRDVPKPTRMIGWWIKTKERSGCPMGLHPKSLQQTPSFQSEFAGGLCSEKSVMAFAYWWDEQQDYKAAVNAVWPQIRKETT